MHPCAHDGKSCPVCSSTRLVSREECTALRSLPLLGSGLPWAIRLQALLCADRKHLLARIVVHHCELCGHQWRDMDLLPISSPPEEATKT